MEVQIATVPRVSCPRCGVKGSARYERLRDELYGAAGEWNMSTCATCRMLWLDPAPRRDELWKAYQQYYTHKAPAGRRAALKGWVAQAYAAAQRESQAGRALAELKRTALRTMLPFWCADSDGDMLGLSRRPPGGVLLDVGCGHGAAMKHYRALGWAVRGIDMDARSVEAAKRSGLEAAVGALEDFNFPSGSFDVITMSHVIEHLFDPSETLAECLRVLKPGGLLAISTPNALSFGHALFRSHWRGLEPPRHVQVFDLESLGAALESAGFRQVTLESTYHWAIGIHEASLRTGFSRLRIPTDGLFKWGISVAALLLASVEAIGVEFGLEWGVELRVHAQKPR